MSIENHISLTIDESLINDIDALINKGLYSSRENFIESAILNQIYPCSPKENLREDTYLGLASYNKTTLENALNTNTTIAIDVFGLLVLNDDISEDLALKTIHSIKISGSLKANDKLKDALKDKFIS